MTPDANDLCVFAIKRGDIENREVYCNSLYPFYLSLIERYKNSPYASGIMRDYVYVNPKTDCSSLQDNDEVSFIPMPNVQEKNNSVHYDLVKYSTVKNGFTVFQRGDLIWAKITPCMQNGKSCIVDNMPTDIGFGSTEFHVIRKKNDSIYMPFIWAVFSNDKVLKAAQATYNGSAGQQRVSASFIESFPAVVPQIDCQKKLVSELEIKLKKFKEKNEKAIGLLSSISEYIHSALCIENDPIEKKSIFAVKVSDAFHVRIDPEYHNPYYTHRVNSIKCLKHDTLGNIISFSTESWNQQDHFITLFPYIEISNVHLKANEYEITEVSKKEAPSRAKMVVRNGDIIVSTTRPQRGAIATIKCEENEIQIASTGFCVLRNMKRSDVLKEYLQWILLDDYVLLQMLQRSSGGNYPAISAEELKKIIIPIPDIDVQKKICDEANKRIMIAKQLRMEAEKEWADAKAQFEKELLGEI